MDPMVNIELINADAIRESGVIAVAVRAHCELTGIAKTLDQQSGGTLRRAMANSFFEGAKGELLEILAPNGS
ncbi:MAG: hypothetical protein AAF418_07595, partial [Pseudomonadota bacterium]